MNAFSHVREYPSHWTSWASWLRERGLTGLMRWILDASDPLRILGAQFLYLGQPFLGGEKISTFAALLEDDESAKAFAAFLEESDS